jgi:hypothetical protein
VGVTDVGQGVRLGSDVIVMTGGIVSLAVIVEVLVDGKERVVCCEETPVEHADMARYTRHTTGIGCLIRNSLSIAMAQWRSRPTASSCEVPRSSRGAAPPLNISDYDALRQSRPPRGVRSSEVLGGLTRCE